MNTINKSVGRDGENLKADAKKIQDLLNAVFPATPLEVDGVHVPYVPGFLCDSPARRRLRHPDRAKSFWAIRTSRQR